MKVDPASFLSYDEGVEQHRVRGRLLHGSRVLVAIHSRLETLLQRDILGSASIFLAKIIPDHAAALRPTAVNGRQFSHRRLVFLLNFGKFDVALQ